MADKPKRTARKASLIVVGLLLLVALPAILTPHLDQRGRGAYDQINYHQRVIETFASQLPTPDLTDYLSATTPGYHLLMSLPRAAGVGIRTLRLVGLVFPVTMLALLAFVLSRQWPEASALQVAALVLPLATTMYVVHAGIWLLPDDAAWLGVACVLMIAFRQRVDAWFYIGGGLALCYLVMMRQIHVWAAAPLWTAAWLGATGPKDGGIRALFEDMTPRVGRGVLALGATLPALLIVGAFVVTWGGLVPPTFNARMNDANPTTPAFILALIGIYATFFSPLVAPSLLDLCRRHALALAGVVGGALVIVIIPESSFDPNAGRWTGLWRLVDMGPTIASRSPVIIGLGVAGAIWLAAWFHALTPRARWVAAAALLAFGAAQTASHEVWQRYNEPFLLILLSLMSVHRRESMLIASRWTIAGPAALAALLGVVNILMLASAWRDEPKRQIPLDELQDVIDRTVTLRESSERMGTP